MEEHGGLGHFCLLEILFGAVKHEVGDTEAQDIVGFLKHLLGFGALLVQVFAHTYKLRALAGKHECFHMSVC